MSTVDDLMHLATLKRQATSLPGLQAYRDALYASAALWAPEAPSGVSILVLDGIIDAVAHETLLEAL